MLTIAAGDNVVRLLPPLIIDEAEHRRRRSRMIERACATLVACGEARQPGCSLMAKRSIRHFIDLIDIPPADLRAIIAAARAMKKRARPRQAVRSAGQTLAMIFDKPSTRTRDLVRGRRCASSAAMSSR